MPGPATQPILIRGARQLLTLHGPQGPRRGTQLNELGIIADGSVLIRDGMIDEVGPTRRLENLEKARGAREISAAGRVVMPGFVDPHTHMIFSRAGRDEAGADAAIRTLLATTAQRLAGRARATLEIMARHGTTTVQSCTACGPNESAESKVLRVLGGLRGRPIEVVPALFFRLPWRGGDAEDAGALQWAIMEMAPKVRRRRQARLAGVIWDSDPAREGLLLQFLDAARALGFRCQVESPGNLPAALLEQPLLSVAHLQRATAEDVALLSRSETVATLLPCSSLRGGAYAPARDLIDSGAAVALGTNYSPRHDPSASMQAAISLACIAMGMSPAEAVSAATVNAAHAIGAAPDAGTLTVGKWGDLLLLNVSDYRDLGTQFGSNLVHTTIRRGNVIYREGAVARQSAQ